MTTTTDIVSARRLVIDQISRWKHLDDEGRAVLADALEDCGLLVVAEIVRRNEHWMSISDIKGAELIQAAADAKAAKKRRHQEWLAELAESAQDDDSEVWTIEKARRLKGYWAKSVLAVFDAAARRAILLGDRCKQAPLLYVIVSDEAVTRAGYSKVENSEVMYEIGRAHV